MRDDIFELYLPIRQFIIATVMKKSGSGDPLQFEIVDRQLDVEVWKHFRKRFFENHFYKVAEEPTKLKKEVGRLATNMRYTLVHVQQVKRSKIWDFDENKILEEADMEILRNLIEQAIGKLHTTKRVLAKDWGTDVEVINSNLRGRNIK